MDSSDTRTKSIQSGTTTTESVVETMKHLEARSMMSKSDEDDDDSDGLWDEERFQRRRRPSTDVVELPSVTWLEETVSGLTIADEAAAAESRNSALPRRMKKSTVVKYGAEDNKKPKARGPPSIVTASTKKANQHTDATVKTETMKEPTAAAKTVDFVKKPQSKAAQCRGCCANWTKRDSFTLFAIAGIPLLIVIGILFGILVKLHSEDELTNLRGTSPAGTNLSRRNNHIPRKFLNCFQKKFGPAARTSLEDQYENIRPVHTNLMETNWQEITPQSEWYQFDAPATFDCQPHTLAWWWLALDEYDATRTSADNNNTSVAIATTNNGASSLETKFALVCLYITLHGRQQHWDWLAHSDPCEWEHIACNAKKEIFAITIDGTDFADQTGSIPAGFITQFSSSLETLSIRNAGVKGALDGDFSSINTLKRINLSGNALTAFPTNLHHCWELTTIDLSDNPTMAGTIPKALATLPFLKHLDLRKNPGLKGPLPPELCDMAGAIEILADCELCGENGECCSTSCAAADGTTKF